MAGGESGRRISRRALGRALFAGSVVIGFLACICSIPAVSGAGWVFDLIANIAAQMLLVIGGVAVVALITRQRMYGAVLVLASMVLLCALPGQRAHLGQAGSATTFSLLVFNAKTGGEHAAAVCEFIRRCDADVVVLTELPQTLPRQLRMEGQLEDIYPHRRVRKRDRGNKPTNVVLSKFSLNLSRIDPEELDPVSVIIGHPWGDFGLVATHPDSPRSPARWRDGNETVLAAAEAARRFIAEGLPVVVAADLNSTPTGWRSRHLCRDAGLLRAKPWLGALGTYPSSMPWPLTVAIDDAFVTPEIKIMSWERLGPAGSDHWGVRIVLALPSASERRAE